MIIACCIRYKLSKRSTEVARRSDVTCLASSMYAAEADVFDFEEILDPIFRPFAPETGLFDTSKRGDLGRDHPGVDTYHAAFQRLCHSPNSCQIAAVEIGCKAEFAVVGQCDHLGLCVKPDRRAVHLAAIIVVMLVNSAALAQP
ncbi:MAG: hypothetical protein RLZZ437_1092 [Pseudomonadota bacterium]